MYILKHRTLNLITFLQAKPIAAELLHYLTKSSSKSTSSLKRKQTSSTSVMTNVACEASKPAHSKHEDTDKQTQSHPFLSFP